MINLKDKNIIVTGASGGIGSSIVEHLYEAGANILATGTRIDKLDQLKSKFSKIKILPFDISNHDKIEDFINDADELLPNSICSDSLLLVFSAIFSLGIDGETILIYQGYKIITKAIRRKPVIDLRSIVFFSCRVVPPLRKGVTPNNSRNYVE